eukprot:scaffold10417_cov33-Tisochrysis_lutea.AAC.5
MAPAMMYPEMRGICTLRPSCANEEPATVTIVKAPIVLQSGKAAIGSSAAVSSSKGSGGPTASVQEGQLNE